MPSYAPSYTPRWQGKYKAAGVEHTVQLRTARGSSVGTITTLGAVANGIFAGFASQLASDFVWISAKYALTDEDLFNPTAVPTSPPTGTVDPADFSKAQRVTSTGFSGASIGSRAQVYFYGILWSLDTIGADEEDSIVTTGENAGVANAIAALTTYGHSGSGALALWHPQATIKVNDFLLKKVRRGIL